MKAVTPRPFRIFSPCPLSVFIALVSAVNLHAQTFVSWNAGGGSDGMWTNANNWNPKVVPVATYKADFGGGGASVPCVVNTTVGGCQVVSGDGGNSATLVVTNGGNLTAGDASYGNPDVYEWTAIGYSATAQMIIEPGATVNFLYHLWIGLNPGANGTLTMNGGSATVGGTFGMGFSGGTGTVHMNGGTLTISGWAPGSGTNNVSISNSSLLDIGAGTVVINGNQVASVDSYISAGRITGYGGTGTVQVSYNGTSTLVTATPPASTPTNQQAYLTIQQSANTLSLFWPTSSIYYGLQSATNLTGTIEWQNVTNTTTTLGGTDEVTLSLPAVPTYYSLNEGVDPGTMYKKLLMGYQGWFACPGDGSAPNAWIHWFHNQTPTAANANTDFMPDLSELGPSELFNSQMTYSNGAAVPYYSAYNQTTVARHFKWMRDNQLDGVFFQRFLSDLSGSTLSLRNQVAVNVRTGAEQYGRVFAIMYDVSGYSTNSIVSEIENDWSYLVNTQHVTNSPAYLHHKGKPVIAIWGFGFNDGNHLSSPQQAQTIINYFKNAGCTVMGGVPTHWRTLNGDSYTNAPWTPVYLSFDVISPWAVGRYSDNPGADNYAATVTGPDLAECTTNGTDYMPVIFPGFSWHNENGGTLNQIPRNGGNFYWRQVYDSINVGCNMIYGAMFDECDEGTAMYKLVATPAQLPAQGAFLALNVDGYNLPSDWYLQLANQAGQMLRGQIPLQSTMPITPP